MKRLSSALLCLWGTSGAASAQAPTNEPISVVHPTLVSTAVGADASDASADGRFVVFESAAGNVTPGQQDTNEDKDIFLLDRITGARTLVSHVPGLPSRAGNALSAAPSISSDGAYVAFASFATDLAPGDANDAKDVFLFERATGSLTLVSRAAGSPTTPGNGSSDHPRVSSDGAYVVFVSNASDLVSGVDRNGTADVFLFERATGTVSLVSHAAGLPTTAGNARSDAPLLSADGGFVAYTSDASDIIGYPDTFFEQVLLYDRVTGLSSLVTHVAGSASVPSDGLHGEAAIDAAGDHVAFQSDATDLAAGTAVSQIGVYVYHRLTGTVSLASHTAGAPGQGANGDSVRPVLSADGRFVAFLSAATDLVAGSDANMGTDVFLHDAVGDATVLASHSAGAPLTAGNDDSDQVDLSADGRFVGFVSRATDLVAGMTDGPGTRDAFFFDRDSGAVTLASHRFGAPTVTASGVTVGVAISADGSSIVLNSYAADLTADVDSNDAPDVLVFDRAQGSNGLVSRRDPALPGLTANRYSIAYSAKAVSSSDGRFVAFESQSTNLVPGFASTLSWPYGGERHLFLRDRLTGVTLLVNHLPGSPNVGANRGVDAFDISRDGRYLAFESAASNLLPAGSPVGIPNVYVFERETGAVSLVSHAFGQPDGAAFGQRPAISGDGGWIAFYSAGTDLVPGAYPPGGDNNVFLFERVTGVVTLVSHAFGSPTTGAGNYQETIPGIDASGRYVVFDTGGTNLFPGDTNPWLDVFLYDRTTGLNALVSHAAGSPTAGNGASFPQVISADGNYVAFRSYANDLVAGTIPGAGSIYLYERATGVVVLASHTFASPLAMPNAFCDEPRISSGGELLIFHSEATDLVAGIDTPSPSNDVFAFERATGEVRLVSHALAGQNVAGNAPALFAHASVSGDGSRVAFASSAGDLVAGTDDNWQVDVFLWEQATGGVSLVSHTFAEGTVSAPGHDAFPQMSADGNFVTYLGASGQIAPWDYNNAGDVFTYGPLHATADIAVTKTDGQATADPGAPLTYTITASNPGPVPVFGAILADLFPVEVEDVSWVCTGSAGGGCGATAGQGDVATTLGLPVGASAAVVAAGTLSPQAMGTVTNTATLAPPAGVTDIAPGNNSATDVSSVTPAADVSVTQGDAPDPVVAGADVSYTMTVANNGPVAATGITLVDALPANTTFISSIPGRPTCTLAAQALSCGLGTLAPATIANVVVVVGTASPGPVTNTAVATAVELDPVPSNDSSSETTLVVERRVGELVPGSADIRSLAPVTNAMPGADLFKIVQQPRSSYEVVVDGVSGDLGSGAGPGVDRVAEDGATVLQSSMPAGVSGSRALRWENAQADDVADQYVRVTSLGCSPCDPEDQYRIRAWETTATGARFNNSGTQATVLVLQNTTDRPVFGTLWLYGATGALLAQQPLSFLPRGIAVLSTDSLAPNASGTFRISHDGGLGALSGKAVAIEPATGFSFDTPLAYRPR